LADIPDADSPTTWLTEQWMAKLAASVEMMTEAAPGLNLSHDKASVSDVPEALWYSIPLTFMADATAFIGAAEDTWLHIGKSTLLAAGVTEVGPDDARGAYLEIVTQATSGLATAISQRRQESVSCLPAKIVKPGSDGLDRALGASVLEITVGEPPARKLYLAWSRGLESGLAAPKSESRELAGRNHAAEKQPPMMEISRTLDLLMEVELPVSVSFGRAQLPLRDVLKLNSGSIVELNRTISDPVEIIVNNCVIARGEVVVVEGNYGVRIHQVISREERLRTLK
jgi:flagellar motor switch protein FliN/FliY